MAIKLHELEINKETDLYKIVSKFSSHTNKVKFALFAAKDCFHLNDEDNKHIAQNCIQLVEKWLTNPENVTQKQLTNAASAAYHASYSASAASYASYSAHANASYAAAHAAYFANAANAANIKQQKHIQYRHYAYSLLRSSSIIPTYTQGKITDKATLMAFLDELSELNENLIIHKDNKVVLNHPDKITTNTLPELVNLIWNDSSLLHYLEHLYGNQIT